MFYVFILNFKEILGALLKRLTQAQYSHQHKTTGLAVIPKYYIFK